MPEVTLRIKLDFSQLRTELQAILDSLPLPDVVECRICGLNEDQHIEEGEIQDHHFQEEGY